MEPQLNGSPYATGPLSGLSVCLSVCLYRWCIVAKRSPISATAELLLLFYILTLLRFNVVFRDVAYMRGLNDLFNHPCRFLQ